jgi:hypothetical protein
MRILLIILASASRLYAGLKASQSMLQRIHTAVVGSVIEDITSQAINA